MAADTTDSLNNQYSSPAPLTYIIESNSTQAETSKKALFENDYRVLVPHQ